MRQRVENAALDQPRSEDVELGSRRSSTWADVDAVVEPDFRSSAPRSSLEDHGDDHDARRGQVCTVHVRDDAVVGGRRHDDKAAAAEDYCEEGGGNDEYACFTSLPMPGSSSTGTADLEESLRKRLKVML